MMFTTRPATVKDIKAVTEIYNEAVLTTDATFDLEPKTEDEQRLGSEKGLRLGAGADRETQENGDDVDQAVACRLGQALGHPALLEQIAEKQHADQRDRVFS